MKTIIRLSMLGLIFWANGSVHAAEVDSGPEFQPIESNFSIRIRPVALAYGIWGGEFYYDSDNGWYAGLSAHVSLDDNPDKNTTLSNNEYGVKIGKFFGKDRGLGFGWWVQTGAFFNNTKVNSFYSKTQQNLSSVFNQYSLEADVGYQFRMTFFDPKHFNIRLGAGVAYKPGNVATVTALDGTGVPIGVRKRLDPSIEFTLGYLL